MMQTHTSVITLFRHLIDTARLTTRLAALSLAMTTTCFAARYEPPSYWVSVRPELASFRYCSGAVLRSPHDLNI